MRAPYRVASRVQNPRNAMRVTNTNGRSSFSFGAAGDISDEQIGEQLPNLEFADVVPLVQGLATDVHGRILVHRRGESAVGPGPIDLIDLITFNGRYSGTLHDQAVPDVVSATASPRTSSATSWMSSG